MPEIGKRLVLLKMEAADRRVFFILRQPKYDHHERPEHGPDNDRYYYEEHSCPTNWLNDVVAVIEGEDADPHGFLKFVRAVDLPTDHDERGLPPDRNNNGIDEYAAWARIFPELDEEDGITIEGDATELSLALPPPSD